MKPSLVLLSSLALCATARGASASVPAASPPPVASSAATPPATPLGEGAALAVKPAVVEEHEAILRPALLAEMDYRIYPTEIEGSTGFAVARMRPGLVFTPTPWMRGVATVEFAGESARIYDAYVSLTATPWLSFTVGYSKPPLFASLNREPEWAAPMPDRAPVAAAFRIERDVGADVKLRPPKTPIELTLRVGNGTGSALGNDNALPAGYAALDLVQGRASHDPGHEDDAVGFLVGGALLMESSRDRSGIMGTTPLGFVYYRPAIVSGARTVAEAHVMSFLGPVRLTVEGAYANEGRSRDDDGDASTPRVGLESAESFGLTAQVDVVVRGLPRRLGGAPRPLPSPNGRWTGGAVEVSLRADAMRLGRGASDVISGGSNGGALAVKWWPTNGLSASLVGFATHYEQAPIDEPDARWSLGGMARLSMFWGQSGQPTSLPWRAP